MMKTITNRTELELVEHIEKLIAAIRGTRVAEVWFEIKHGKPPIQEEPLPNRPDATVTQPASLR